MKLLTSLFDILQPFFEISGRNFIYQISKSDGFFVTSKKSEFHYLTFLKNEISPGRDFLMFLTSSKYFWHKLNILIRNLKNENWLLQSHHAGISLCFWPVPNSSGINWTFWSEISKTTFYRCNLTRPGFPYVFDHFQIFLA